MATIRVGFSSDFNVSGSKIGIGTANPTSLLEVTGTAKGDLNISGVSTLTAYSGFIAQNQRITKEHNVGYSLLVLVHSFKIMKLKQDLLNLVVFIMVMINITIPFQKILS